MSQNISAQQAYEWLKSGEAILIDVREPDEFKSEHIAYASSYPLSCLEDVLADVEIPKDRKVIFHCLKGMRGIKACEIFGDSKIACYDFYNIEGGINAWKEAELPVISWVKEKSISVMRQVQIIVGLLVLLAVLAGFSGVMIGFVLAGIFGGLLAFAGFTGWCGMAMLLQKMPWNK